MRIRKAKPEEAEIVAKDFWKPLAEMMTQYSKMNELEEDAAEHGVDGFRKLIEKENSGVLLLEREGEDIGFLSFERGKGKPRREATISR